MTQQEQLKKLQRRAKFYHYLTFIPFCITIIVLLVFLYLTEQQISLLKNIYITFIVANIIVAAVIKIWFMPKLIEDVEKLEYEIKYKQNTNTNKKQNAKTYVITEQQTQKVIAVMQADENDEVILPGDYLKHGTYQIVELDEPPKLAQSKKE